MEKIDRFIQEIPKAELHIHIEGSFEPDLIFQIAQRNHLKTRYPTVKALQEAYSFNNLQQFLDIYYTGADVLLKEEDFYDLTMSYLKKAREQNIVHTEIFFDPQTHTARHIAFETVIQGISQALRDGQRDLGITSRLILCFLRHLSEESAMKMLKEAIRFRHLIAGVGLDSSETGYPPLKFRHVFSEAAIRGFITVAHAGEEGPASYIWEALELLNVKRIDHGIRSIDDEDLMKELVRLQVPLTVCPLSNQKLKVVPDLRDHPIKKMLDRGMMVTVNSDDPAYFGGYINENYTAITHALNLSIADIYKLACNSFIASFLDEESIQSHLREIERIYSRYLEEGIQSD